MATRISFNKPQGQTIHLNNNFGGGPQSSAFYQGTAEPFPPTISYNHAPTNYYQHGVNGNAGVHIESSAFYRNNQIVPPPHTERETVAIERERVEVKEIQRPQFQKVYNMSPPHKKLGPEEDPPSKSSCCHPCWFALAAILGIAAITLALLFGLGVIGGSSNSPNASVIIAKPSATATSTSSSTTSTSTITASSSSAVFGSIPTGVTSVSSTGGITSASASTSASSLSTGVQPASINPIEVPPTTTTPVKFTP